MLPILLLSLLGVGVQSTVIPECASGCVGEAIEVSLCPSADTPCICSSRAFLPSLQSCIEHNCEGEEQLDAIAHADQFCAAAQPHGGLRARDAEPEAAPEAEAWAQPPGYGSGGKPPAYGGNKHHEKCRNHKYPYWSPSSNKCVKKCKPHHYLKANACHPTNDKHHHHPKCKTSPRPYWSPYSNKCVKHCKPHHYLKDKECHPENKHHHDKCKHSPHPYWSIGSNKCVKQCKPGDYLKGKECHPHKPHKPTTLHTTHHQTPPHYPTPTHKPHTTHTSPPTYYTPTATPTVY